MRRPNRLLSVCIGILLLFPLVCAASAAGRVFSHRIDGINTSRGTDQMIVYNEGDTTHTNEWGYEVSVDASGVVIAAGGNDIAIPEGGFVVSGHGASRTWLMTYVRKGMCAFFNSFSKTVSFSADPIDPSYSYSIELSGTNVARGTDMLVLYDRSWSANTKTNIWGYEVCVDKTGRVSSVGGNSQNIPEGGFVLSAHGSSIEELKNLCLDELIEISKDGKSVQVTYDGRSALRRVQEIVSELKTQAAARKEAGVMGDFVKAAELLAEAEQVLKETDRSDGNACFESEKVIDELIRQIRPCLTESVSGEYRGVWLRPDETTPEQVAARVQKLYEGGVNMIAIEVFFSSEVIYSVPEDCAIGQMNKYTNFDILQCYIDECHKRQMELHAWHPNVYAANSPNVGIPLNHPDWLMVSNEGGTAVPTEYGDMYFIDPFNKEATDALLRQYRYLFTHYDIDAFQLDYIRYPGQGSGLDWGYNESVLKAFQKKYGVRPEYNTSASYWRNWCQFRADAVTDFVRSVRELANEVRPDMLVTADVFTDIDNGLQSVYQEYARWMEEGLVDMIHPMAYTTDNKVFENIIKTILSKGYSTPVAPGLGTYTSGYTADLAMDQIMIARRYGCVGVVHFQAVPFLSKNLPLSLNASVCRGISYLPYRDSVRACENSADILLRRSSTTLIENGFVSASEAETLKKAADATKRTFTSPEPTDAELKKAIMGLDSPDAVSILMQDLTRLEGLMTFLRPDGKEQLVSVERGLSVEDFAKSESVSDVCLRNGFPASLTDRIATGMYALKNGIRRAAVVLGDLNGDGEISAVDYLLCKRHVLGTGLLSGPYLQAAQISGSDDVSAVDYLLIKKHVLDLGEIPLI